MNRTYKPEGHTSVSVYMMANNAQSVVDFAKEVFGAEEILRKERADGSIMHAEIRIDDTVLMVADAMDDYPGFPVWLHVYVPDVDETYRRALASGAAPVQEPVQKGDPDKRGGVKDPAGNIWWIATQTG